jgi:hypothetical protein
MTTQPDIRDVVYWGNTVSKETIKEHSINLLADLDNGYITPLQLAAQLKYFEDIIANVKEEVRQRVVAEQSKYGKERMTFKGATFDIKEAGIKYDYSNCDDTIWNDLKQQLNDLNDKMKEREAFLKTLKERFTYVDESTGEIVTIYPPQKKSTTTYAITWSKE